MTPLISVIIPTCDRPHHFLLRAIESVCEQSLSANELIVVNNGRPENLPLILPPQVKLFNITPYAGVSRARNFGAAMATNELIAFLDDDDWWDHDFLKESFQSLISQDVKAVYGRVDRWFNGKQWCHKLPSEDLCVEEILYKHTATGGQNMLIEKEIFFKVGGFDEKLKMCEDRSLAIELLLSGEKLGFAINAIAVVRHHCGDRLRHHKFRRLPYILKYRKLMTKRILIFSLVKYFMKSTLNSAKNFLHSG